jgi:hypothetical protein
MMENYQDTFAAQQAKTKAQIERARQMQQYNAPKGPGMVGNIYVPTHPLQYAAELLRNYQGKKLENEATSEFENVSGQRNKAIADALRGFTTNMAGAPEQRTPMQADYFDEADRASLGGNQNLTAVTPERKADPLAAYQSLMNAPDPQMQRMGMQNLMQFQQKQAEDQQVKAKKDQQAQLWQQSGGNPQAFLEAGGELDFAQNMMTGKSLGTPTVVRTVETVDERGRPVTQGFDANNNPVGPAIPKYVAPKAPTAGPAAPAGYRYKADGSLEAIPGGPADIKAGEIGIKRERQQQGAVAQADRIIGKVDQALSKVGLNTTGIGGAVMRSIPGSEAKNLESDLETIKANLGFAELQAMRDASPTGGALGAIAVQELIALQSTVASLDQAQDSAQLKARLGEIRTHYENWKNAVTQASGGPAPSETPQGRPGPTPQNLPQTRPNAAPQVGTVQGGYVFLGGDPSKPTSWRQQ